MKRFYAVLLKLRQRGQALVEFAFILPLFLMMFFCLVYGGWVFTDYITFSNIASSCARNAAAAGISDGEFDYYRALNEAVKSKNSLRSGAFVWNPTTNGNGNDYLYIVTREDSETHDYMVTVYLTADLDTRKSYLGTLVHRLMTLTSGSDSADKYVKSFINIEYTMYRENLNKDKD